MPLVKVRPGATHHRRDPETGRPVALRAGSQFVASDNEVIAFGDKFIVITPGDFADEVEEITETTGGGSSGAGDGDGEEAEDLTEFTKAEIMAQLDDYGVAYDKKANKAELTEQLRTMLADL